MSACLAINRREILLLRVLALAGHLAEGRTNDKGTHNYDQESSLMNYSLDEEQNAKCVIGLAANATTFPQFDF